ncbi:hypothetical protein [Candidatus Nitrosocosmicus arcticus]|uniref:Resolvase HTH domain-containing protein n=1 Tax=Candidatus Nitrosocosmicus arcticus TaxID=2035267 RepID=A0A557SU77_9ARCH|nr:hypothetical protein [Candidatus Nitrosocosmicus arcticus]TVP40156.1 hypothetical protein NARC_90062 [Candidatus Nitrosocosmicus arcticus]
MIHTKEQKEKQVIKLAENGYTTREIAKTVRISLGDIGKILKKHNGEEWLDEKLSTPSRALQMFERGQRPIDVAIHLNLDTDATMNLHRNYYQLRDLDTYSQLLDDLGPDLPKFLYLYQALKNNGLLTMEFIKDFINQYNTVTELRVEVCQLNDFLVKLQDKKLDLERVIEYDSKKYPHLRRTGERRRYLTSHSETEFDVY